MASIPALYAMTYDWFIVDVFYAPDFRGDRLDIDAAKNLWRRNNCQ